MNYRHIDLFALVVIGQPTDAEGRYLCGLGQIEGKRLNLGPDMPSQQPAQDYRITHLISSLCHRPTGPYAPL